MSQSTRDGRDWQPQFLLDIDRGTCIGCGRCFKVCGRGVMKLKGKTEDGELVDLVVSDDDDDGNCIGCGACARVCPTNAQRHGPAS